MRAFSKTVTRAKSLRRDLTLPEVLLWQVLRRDATGARFRRQHPVGPYILDFYCATAKLAVEIDGLAHAHPVQARHDGTRDAWLSAAGIRILRFDATDILDQSRRRDALDTIVAAAAGAPSTAFGGPPSPLRG